LCAAGSGCAHLHDSGQNEDLDHNVDLYWKAVHWQDAVAGSVFVFADERADWLKTHDKEAKNLNLTSWEVHGEKVDKDGKTGTVMVKITWYLLPSLVEKSGLCEQRWVYRDGKWVVISEKDSPLPFP
jgi:hypothetical protein